MNTRQHLPTTWSGVWCITAPRRRPEPQRIRVSSNVQSAKLIRQAAPIYPQEAKEAGIVGHVILNIVVGKDGTVQDVSLVSGHPLLVAPAKDAVKQWVYQPTLLNGEPVEVVTQVEVNLTPPE